MAILDGKEAEFDQMYSKPAKSLSERYEMTKEALSQTMEPKLDAFESGAASFSEMIDHGAVRLAQKIKERYRRRTMTSKSDSEALLSKDITQPADGSN